MAMVFIMTPVLNQVQKIQPLNPVSQYSWLTYLVFFLMSLMLAPGIFWSVIIPSFGDRFRFTLTESLTS
jgi:hypothetical protein